MSRPDPYFQKFKKDRRGKVVAYIYDSRNRLIKKRYFNSLTAYDAFPDSVPAESLVFTYDAVGNMVSMLDNNDIPCPDVSCV